MEGAFMRTDAEGRRILSVNKGPGRDLCACGVPWPDVPDGHYRGYTMPRGGGPPVYVCKDAPARPRDSGDSPVTRP